MVLALAAGKGVQEAAEAAGVSRRTVSRRLADPVFQASLAEARRAVLVESLNLLTSLSARAVQRLGELLKSKDERVCISAARSILLARSRMQADHEFSERIAALERLVEAHMRGRRR